MLQTIAKKEQGIANQKISSGSSADKKATPSLMESPAAERWLQTFCDRTPQSVEGAVMLLEENNTDLNKVAQWPQQRQLSLTIMSAARAAVQRMQPLTIVPAVTEHGSEYSCIMAAPLRFGTQILGAVAVAIRTSDSEVTATLLADLVQSVTTLVNLLNTIPAASRPADAFKLLQLQTAFLAQTKLAEAAGAFASELATMLKFSRVSIGLMEHGHIQILAISNSADFKNHQELLRSIAAAMEEATDQAESVTFPELEDSKLRIRVAQAALVKRTGNALCSIPLVSNGNIIGALSLEHQGLTPLSREAIIWYEHIAILVAPLLELKLHAEYSWFKRVKESMRAVWAKFWQRDNPQPKIILATVLLAIASLTLIPMDYRVGAQAHIEGSTQRILSASADGFIQRANARPGDLVKAGDVLIELAEQDLQLEKRKWESEIIQQENNFSGALARQDRTQYAVSQAKATQARAELDLIEQQLSRSRIVAPIDGLVLEGDLSQLLGAPVKRGDKLMVLAPSNQYRLMIDVDERDISDVHTGQKGYLALSAQPIEKMAFVVQRITPVAMVKNGRNTFEVEAKLTDSSLFLRPGLQGVAKIEAGSKPLFWNLSHRIIDWLRLTFWSWGI